MCKEDVTNNYATVGILAGLMVLIVFSSIGAKGAFAICNSSGVCADTALNGFAGLRSAYNTHIGAAVNTNPHVLVFVGFNPGADVNPGRHTHATSGTNSVRAPP
jgi:hypothetical protein